MAKNPTKGPNNENVIDFQKHVDDKDLCIFVQRKLAFTIAYKIRQIFNKVNFCLLLLFYLCAITTYIAVMQVVTHQPTNPKQQEAIEVPTVKLEPIDIPSIGY